MAEFTLIKRPKYSSAQAETYHNVSLQELAKYAKTLIQQNRANPDFYFMFDGKPHRLESPDGETVVLLSSGLVDTHNRSFSDDLGFLTMESYHKAEDGLYECSSLRYYMPLEWAARVVAETESEARSELGSIVRAELETGVKHITQIVKDGLNDVKEVQAEKHKLIKERERIQSEIERMERLEQQLEQRQQQEEARRLQLKKEQVEKQKSKPVRNRAGYVYLLRAIHDASLYKIGRTSNPANRSKTFNVKLPFPVGFVCLIQSADMYSLESELHAKYKSKRLEGEWFRLESEDVDYIQQLSVNTDIDNFLESVGIA
jgi:hypothetical protein